SVLSGSAVWAGPIQLAGKTLINVSGIQTLQNGVAGAKLNITGAISDLTGTSNNEIDKTGGGTLILSGTNTYTGFTDIHPGVVVANNKDALGSPTGSTTVESGTALYLQSDLELEPITLNGDGIPFDDHNTGALRNISNNNTFTGTLTLGTNSTIGVDSGSSL